MTLQNQKGADEKYFPTTLIRKIKLQLKGCLNLLWQVDALSYDALRVVSSVQILYRTLSGRKLNKKKRWIKIELPGYPELTAHLEDDLNF